MASKRSKKAEQNGHRYCIVHYDHCRSGTDVRCLTECGFTTIQNTVALRQRLHKPNQRLDGICDSVPTVFDAELHGVHRWCYAVFTNVPKLRPVPVPDTSVRTRVQFSAGSCSTTDFAAASIEGTAPFCLIHNNSCDQDIHTNLISPHDLQSWSTLLEAAHVHRFKPLLDLSVQVGDGVIPTVFYHSYCRNLFIDSLKKPCSVALQNCSQDGVINTGTHQFHSSFEPQVKSRLRSSEKCRLGPSDTTEINCYDLPSRAFEFISQHVSDRLNLRKDIFSLESIVKLYVSKLAEYGLTDGCESIAPMDLKCKLQQKFGRNLQFKQVEINGPTLLYPDALTFDDLLKRLFELLNENFELKKLPMCHRTVVVNAETQTDDETVVSDNDEVDLEFGPTELTELDKPTMSANSETVELETYQRSLVTEIDSCDFNYVSIQPVLETLKMAAEVNCQRRCVCHLDDTMTGQIKLFGNGSWESFCKYVAIWKDLDGVERIIAEGLDMTAARGQGYHSSCLLMFADHRKIKAAFKRLADTGRQIAQKCGSRNGGETQSASSDKTPGECIFCHTTKYYYDSKLGRRKLAQLFCWGSHAPNSKMLASIRQTAERLGDERILELLERINTEPKVVLKGHKGCHSTYIHRPRLPGCVQHSSPLSYDAEFKQFCNDVIDKRVVEGGEMLPRPELNELFAKYVDLSQPDQLSARDINSWTKMVTLRLKKRYGDQVSWIHVHGFLSHLLVSKARLHQILTDANSVWTEAAGSEVALERSFTIGNLGSVKPLMDEAPYHCISCHKKFESCVELDSHRNANYNCAIRYVELVKRAAEFSVDLHAITGVPHLQRYQCLVCLACCNTSELLQQHEKVHSDTTLDLYTCKVCAKWFRQAEQYNQHADKIHGFTTAACQQCKHCGQDFAKTVELREHMRHCVHDLLYFCQYCSKRFYEPGRLKTHVVRQHQTKRAKFFACEHCNRLFHGSWSYCRFKAHLRNHSSVKTKKLFCCEICGQMCVGSSKLKRHMLAHAGIRSYLCEFCSKVFADVVTLRYHRERVHSNFRPYLCPDCGKSYAHAFALKHHVVSHSGLKPFVCLACGKGFGMRRLLEQHMRSHTKPYSCDVCGKQFAHSWTLKSHVATCQEDTMHCKVEEYETETLSAPVYFITDSDICGEVELPFTALGGVEEYMI